MTPAQIAGMTDAELRTILNAPRSDGETILSEKSDEWARRYQETSDVADFNKALDCAQASMHLYDVRMADRKAAYAEWTRRQEDAGYVLSLNWGDNLSHFEHLETAIAAAKRAMAEGYDDAQVWHCLAGTACDIDPDQECEFTWVKEEQDAQPTADTSTSQIVTAVGPMRATCPHLRDAAYSADTYGTPAHEQALIEEERESERWASVNLQDAYSQIGKRETEGLA